MQRSSESTVLRPPPVGVDMTTNYRKFYDKDVKFFEMVLREEEITNEGHEFKLQLFKDKQYEAKEPLPQTFAKRKFDDYLASVLIPYKAQNQIFEFKQSGESIDGVQSVTFVVKNQWH